MFKSLFLGALALPAVLAASSDDWRGRSIYQVLTDRFATSDDSSPSCNINDYCGGTWKGIETKLDYIQGMGFTAIWISPITAQVQGNTADGSSYHGYWQNDLYSLNSKFGTADDLKSLSTALHQRGMYLMVDIVVNHFGWIGDSSSVDYSTYNPFNNQEYFHPYCPIDYNNATSTEVCWMGDSTVELPDLDTTRSDVQDQYHKWISGLVSDYGIDGLRIDTCLEVQPDFFPDFMTAAGVYAVCEVDNGDPGVSEPYQQVVPGVLNYPLYWPIIHAFGSTSGSMSALADMVNTVKGNFKDSTLLGTFTENHDNPRFPSITDDMAQAQNAIAFGMLADGIPIVYEGQEQHYAGGGVPNNREDIWQSGYKTDSQLYKLIAQVNQLRNHAVNSDSSYLSYKAYPIYSDTTTIAMRKSSIVGVFSNKGSNGASYQQSIPSTGFASGETVVEVLGCSTTTADSNGAINVSMGQGAVKIFYAQSGLKGTGICGN